jgi:uncharacterized protein YjiS (DUF1127 family)
MLTDTVGYFAAGLVFATFCAQRMVSLRALAIASNVAFIGYGYLDGLFPILLLHCAMLPINVLRCRQSMRSGGLVPAVEESSMPKRPVPLDRAEPLRNWIIAVLGRLRSWRKHKAFRRELSAMSARDLRDLKVPPGLVTRELRRWPWQEPSRQWRTVAAKWSAANEDQVTDLGRSN